MELIIVRGLPGSGKSTWIKNNYLPDDHVWFEPDHIVTSINKEYLYSSDIWNDALSMTYKLADIALSKGKSVVVSDVFCGSFDIYTYAELAAYYNADFKVYRIKGDYGNIHNVPYLVYQEMISNFEDYSDEIVIENKEEE